MKSLGISRGFEKKSIPMGQVYAFVVKTRVAARSQCEMIGCAGGFMRFAAVLFLSLLSLRAHAAIDVGSPEADEIFKSVEAIGQIEEIELIHSSASGRSFALDQISCVFEMYNACSFFADVRGERRLLVATDGTARFMRALANAGVAVDDDRARMDVEAVICEEQSGAGAVRCHIQ
jgi:hypothetical protein